MNKIKEEPFFSDMATERKDYLATVAFKLREEIYEEVADTIRKTKFWYCLYGLMYGMLIGTVLGSVLTTIGFLLWR